TSDYGGGLSRALRVQAAARGSASANAANAQERVSMLNIAFKEWALICRALAEGRQALILRKGGVAEGGGAFRPEHDRFWLNPTFVHALRPAVKPAVRTLFDRVLAERPSAGKVRLTHFAEVRAVYCARRWQLVASLDNLHFWTEETVRTKFN